MVIRRRDAIAPRTEKVLTYSPRPRTPAPALGLVSMLPLGQDTTRVTPKRSAPTAAECEHMGRVAALGCILCGSPAEVHHIRDGHGMSQRASNWLTIPACAEHHRGPRGLHGDRSALRAAKLTELDLLAMTIERLSC